MTLSRDEHTVKRFDQELSQLRTLVLEMGGMVEDQIGRAVQSLENEDLNLAREVVTRDYAVNALEIKADETSINLIALRQPLGSDLRMIMALSKSVTDLERIGDEAEKIARMVIRIYDNDTLPPNSRFFRDVNHMAKLASALLRGSLDALARLDLQKAVEIAQGDEEIDQEFQGAVRRLITYMMEDPRTVGHAIDVTFMLKALERIGDHARNVAEHVIYLIKGKDVRHSNPETLERDILQVK